MIQPISGFDISASTKRLLLGLMALGLIVFVAGLLTAPERIWPNFLIAEYYLLGLGLGGAFIIAVQYVSYAGWGTAFRRIPEAITSTLPVAGVGVFVLIFGIHSLYEWSHSTAVAGDEILQGKSAWLNQPFFIARLIGYFVLWIGLSRIIVRNSLRQDTDDDVIYTKRNVRNSVFFIILGVYTFCLASIDLLMSLQPHWYSTVFGFLNLSGMFMSGLAIVAVLLVILRRAGFAHIFTADHLHDVGRLLMSFSVFWVYMWVSQHMLIWYSNIPEETSYYVFRHFGGWGSLSFLNVVLNWLIPFVVLLPRASKRNDKIMLYIAVVVLIGHWLDLYIMVMPTAFGAEPTLGIWEIAPLAGVMALFFWATFRTLAKKKLLPVNDPYLVESLPYI
ncbi:MAG: hypothetical protein ACE5I1_02340 [bacterium]